MAAILSFEQRSETAEIYTRAACNDSFRVVQKFRLRCIQTIYLLSSAAGLCDRCSDTRACPNGFPRPRSRPWRQYRCLFNAMRFVIKPMMRPKVRQHQQTIALQFAAKPLH